MERMNTSIRVLVASIVSAALTWPMLAVAQTGCGTDGYRVISQRWDAVLRGGWELRQNCTHPEWPVRLSSMSRGTIGQPKLYETVAPESIPAPQPLLVHGGETVRLWQQDDKVRIEMYGVAEQSARAADRIIVRIVRQHGDEAASVERIAGIVRATRDVEMER